MRNPRFVFVTMISLFSGLNVAQAAGIGHPQPARESWEQMFNEGANAGVPDFQAEIFRNVGANPGSLPNQQAMVHFPRASR